MGANSSKSGSTSKGAGTIAERNINRKANKEDLFTLVSYSILAESTISDSAFPYWQKKERKAKRRHPQLLAELQSLAASVLCLQDVEAEFFQTVLKPELSRMGYEGELMKMPGKGSHIGNATFWHVRTFRLLKTHKINLNSVAKEAAKAANVDAKSSRLLNSSGALVTLLQLLPDKHAKQHCVVVANSRLLWDETQPDVQALEAGLLMKELQGYAEHVQEFKEAAGLNEVSVGYLVAGDLGATPKSPAYGLLKKGQLDEKEAKKLSKCPQIIAGKGGAAQAKTLQQWFPNSFQHKWAGLKSAYATVVGKEPPFTIYTDRVRACHDYVWYTGENLNANSALEVPDEAVLKPLQGLPNAKYPSDHLPLVFGFRFKKSEAFTSALPFEGPSGASSAVRGDAAAEGGEGEEDDLAPRGMDALDEILGFAGKDDKQYDRYGYERERSGISRGEDMTTEHWQAAPNIR